MECYYFPTESGDGDPEQNVRVSFTTALEIRTNLTRSAGKLRGRKKVIFFEQMVEFKGGGGERVQGRIVV